MTLPIIQATSCPLPAELADKANRWSIVWTSSGRAYLGRVIDGEIAAGGFITLGDPFDYYEKRELAGDPKSPRIGMARQLFPVSHWDVDEIVAQVSSVIAVARLAPRAVDKLREDLIPAWEGRDHLRKHGGRLELVGAGTKIEPIST